MSVREPDTELRDVFVSLSDDAAPTDSCLTSERIFDAVAGTLSQSEIAEVIDHTSTCGACAEAWRLAMELSPPKAQVVASPSRRSLWYAAGAIALAAALLLFVMTRSTSPAKRPIHRGNGNDAILAEVADGAALSRSAFTLRWRAKDKPIDYLLEVFTPRMRILHTESGLVRPSHTVPPGALADVGSGTKLYWRVKARMPDGSSVISDTFMVMLQ